MFSSSKVELYSAKPTCMCFKQSQWKDPASSLSLQTFKWERHFGIPLSLLSKLKGTIVCVDSLKWIYPEEHDIVVSAFRERSQLHGKRGLCVEQCSPQKFCPVSGTPSRFTFLFKVGRIPPLPFWVVFFFLMVFSNWSKWQWSVEADSKIYNVFVLADCQLNRSFPAVLYADLENQ